MMEPKRDSKDEKRPRKGKRWGEGRGKREIGGKGHAVERRAEAQVIEAGQLGIEVAFVRNHTD